MRVKPFLLSFFLIFVSISLLLSIWFIINLLTDLSETLYGDAILSCFHPLSRILASFFFSRLGFDAICLPIK
jgi:Ca2+/Na+ antiporter